MATKKIIFSILLLSTLASNNAVAMENNTTTIENIDRIIHLSYDDVASFAQRGEHPFLIINNTKHYAYPDPSSNTYKLNPQLFPGAFMHCIDLNLNWRRQNGHSTYEINHYQTIQRKALEKLQQQIWSKGRKK